MSAQLQANSRENSTRSMLRKLRNEGKIPAVVYGGQVANKSVTIDSHDFLRTIKENGRNGIITLQVDGDQHTVMLHDYQKDPIHGEMITHADFQVVDSSAKVEVDVNVHLIGKAPGVKAGGIVQQPLHQLTIKVTATDVPKAIDVDIASLEVGDSIYVGDIRMFRDYEILHEDNEVVVSILPPKLHADETQEEASEQAEEKDFHEKAGVTTIEE
ncbi:50S ribosomal protein L25/general stress protein Ctc [Bacillus sp. HMF5848]|uniref:50S ribosomal protein L25/general stress protein Ctc n=1 Tax=Bacillus sp. HMF5848 TaxID=2495421 RepID=UPI000F7A77D9|nr:50S ribosomal protein L25/general stress protein Ctc [Bacillus sp. HMF5848]RSK25486.1 50S ribosomal protein L25/general stress protein Ctc [Bacillus sp. HMF5848]